MRHLGVALNLLLSAALPAAAHAQIAGPAITVYAQAAQHPISPYIYGMAEYGVARALQQSAHLSVLRWGGDGATRYNWQVDSSNAGFDWYFMGGNGNANPTPSGGPDALVLADQATKSALLADILSALETQAAGARIAAVASVACKHGYQPFPGAPACGSTP